MTSQIESLPNPPRPLSGSYTYHSKCPTATGKYMLGVDEAGRGPVLGPLVYAAAFCPIDYKEQLEEMGFNDSKALTPETRSMLLNSLSSDPENLGWTVRVISPQDLSVGMLRRPPTNLNKQSENATILLIREVIAKGIELEEVYIDALGNTTTYQAYLSSLFPAIPTIVVTQKADSKFKIVGAASVAAKVTRDAWIDGWIWEEDRVQVDDIVQPEEPLAMDIDEQITSVKQESPPPAWLSTGLGSGYPSDPKTQAWLRASVDPVFGYPSITRFSWATVKVALDKDASNVRWIDDGQNIAKAFESGKPLDKGRSDMMKELAIRSIDTL